jgi:hypothetical protein
LLGCAPGPDGSRPVDSAEAQVSSGFLGDYAELRAGKGTGARLVYLDSAADFSGYTRVVIEPVVVWKSSEARFAGVRQAQREVLARQLDTEMRRAFAEEFVVAEVEPGPGTLRLRTALTAAIAAAESSDPGLLQYAEVEVELLDAVTNRRLAAAVDSKGWIDSRAKAGEGYVEAGAAFKDWAERASIRLAALRTLDRNFGQPESP